MNTPIVKPNNFSVEILCNQLLSEDRPLRMFLKGDIVHVERTHVIESGNIYYIVNKETQEDYCFCTITDDLDRYTIHVDDEHIEIMKGDIFTCLDVFKYTSFERFI